MSPDTGDSSGFRLHVEPAHGTPFERELTSGSVIVGRARDADVVVPDRFLSRQHARITVRGDRLVVEDLGSLNGTLLNGDRIEESAEADVGDILSLSSSRITIQAADGALTGSSGTILLKPASELLDTTSTHRVVEETRPDQVRRTAERLELLNDIHRALGRSLQLDELYELILDRVFDHLQPEEAVIFLRDDDGSYHRAATRSIRGGDESGLHSETLIREVGEKQMSALALDAELDERFASAQSLMSRGVRSLLAAPLYDAEGSLGMIVVDSRVHVHQFSEEDLELLTSIASAAALRIRNVSLMAERVRRQQLERELELARRIQVRLLPVELPEFPGLDIHAQNDPSLGVSGDFYVVERRADDSVLMVADVSGKGISASLLAASFEALTAGPIERGASPDTIFDDVARYLYARTPQSRYATAFLVAIEPDTGHLTYANAGHNPALLVHSDGEVEELGATGTPVGLLPNSSYECATRVLDPGDTLVIYTDGITEATDVDDEEYGLARLTAACRRASGESAAVIAERIDTELARFVGDVEFGDDRTMLIVRRRPE